MQGGLVLTEYNPYEVPYTTGGPTHPEVVC